MVEKSDRVFTCIILFSTGSSYSNSKDFLFPDGDSLQLQEPGGLREGWILLRALPGNHREAFFGLWVFSCSTSKLAMVVQSPYAKCSEVEVCAMTKRTYDLGMWSLPAYSSLQITGEPVTQLQPTDVLKQVHCGNWESLAIRGIKYILQTNAMPIVFRLCLGLED